MGSLKLGCPQVFIVSMTESKQILFSVCYERGSPYHNLHSSLFCSDDQVKRNEDKSMAKYDR